MRVSSNLQTADVKLIGRWLHGNVLLPYLKIGFTLASFQSSGIEPDCSDLLNSRVRGLTNSHLASFKTRGEIVSGPGDLLSLSLSMHFDTSLSVIVMILRISLFRSSTAGTEGMSL